MEKNIVLKKKIVYVLLIVVALSLYFNYSLYNENKDFKVRMGGEYQVIFSKTLFQLNDADVNYWIETLQNEEDGELLLGRYIGNLNEIENGYMKMSSEVRIIGEHIGLLTNQLHELKKILDEKKDIEVYKEEFNSNIAFLRNVLKQVETDLGTDKNEVLWYKELSGFETKTGNYIVNQYKEWERESK